MVAPPLPASARANPPPDPTASRRFWRGLGRAVAGAVVFSLPLYMTMEMWQLGVAMDRGRLALLAALTFPLLVGLSHVSGFEPTFDLREDVVDAAVAWAVGVATGAGGMLLLGVLHAGQSVDEIVGTITLQAIPGSIGALLAHSQFGHDPDGDGADGGTGSIAEDDGGTGGADGRPSTYASQLFVMAVGALFLAFNVAPTEEMVLIAYVITPWHLLALVGVSLAARHAFVSRVGFGGQESAAPGTPAWSVFARYTVVGYAVAAGISAYVLWTFGRLDGTGVAESVATVLVLALPAAIGAAAARLLL